MIDISAHGRLNRMVFILHKQVKLFSYRLVMVNIWKSPSDIIQDSRCYQEGDIY